MNAVVEEIIALKKQLRACILAHNYVAGEIQDIADFTGDSLELSIRASECRAEVIVCCGVRFMAETAKLLSPQATVLLPNSQAGCPMADMADSVAVADYRRNHPEEILVAYVNTTAATKSQVDICCTSGNADRVVAQLPADKEIMFLPDRNLGKNLNDKLGRKMKLWDGCCPIHDRVTPEMILASRAAHPGAAVLLHLECPPEAVKLADHALSTAGMLKLVKASDKSEFIIGTEGGILHRLQKENPGKHFYELSPQLRCADMKKITLENLRDCLKNRREEIHIDPAAAERARLPIEKMLKLS